MFKFVLKLNGDTNVEAWLFFVGSIFPDKFLLMGKRD